MEKIWLAIRDFLGTMDGRFWRILATIVVVLSYVAVRAIVLASTRAVRDANRKYFTRKISLLLLGFVCLVVLVGIWLGESGGVFTYLGILSAGLAIAMQEPLANIAGGLYLAIRRPFAPGDRIEIGGHTGDVADITVTQFSMAEVGNWVGPDQSTGRLIHIPNRWLFRHPVANYTQGFDFIWNELAVAVTFESDWEKAKRILVDIADQHTAVKSDHAAQQIRKAARPFMILYDNLSPIVRTSVAANGIVLTVCYLCPSRKRRASAEKIWEEILRRLARHDDIDFAYQTVRVYSNVAEGKPALRPDAAPAHLPPGSDGMDTPVDDHGSRRTDQQGKARPS